MPASSEFVALCHSQVALLSQGLSASVSIVYLTEEFAEGTEAKLIPIAAYPETSVVWEEREHLRLNPSFVARLTNSPRLLSAGSSLEQSPVSQGLPPVYDTGTEGNTPPPIDDETWVQQRQVVLPLMHEGVVMGFLVTSRDDRPWNEQERSQIERIAHTLTLACIIDQRSQWLEHNYHRQQLLQSQQHDLLDNLLHQLRSPLTALKTFGKLLLKRLLPTDRNRDLATNILRESDRVQELLQQMDQTLDLSVREEVFDPATLPVAWETVQPIERSPDSLPLLPASTLETCSVVSILEPLLVSAQAIAEERQLECQANLAHNVPLVKANPTALREVFSNLIDNALKYTPAGGKIWIQLSVEENQTTPGIVFSITDTGPGIPASDLAHIFERHYRGVQADTEIPGTGLGLAIAKDLVEQMQGQIQVQSPADLSIWRKSFTEANVGTTFRIWLPSVPSEISHSG